MSEEVKKSLVEKKGTGANQLGSRVSLKTIINRKGVQVGFQIFKRVGG